MLIFLGGDALLCVSAPPLSSVGDRFCVAAGVIGARQACQQAIRQQLLGRCSNLPCTLSVACACAVLPRLPPKPPEPLNSTALQTLASQDAASHDQYLKLLRFDDQIAELASRRGVCGWVGGGGRGWWAGWRVVFRRRGAAPAAFSTAWCQPGVQSMGALRSAGAESSRSQAQAGFPGPTQPLLQPPPTLPAAQACWCGL